MQAFLSDYGYLGEFARSLGRAPLMAGLLAAASGTRSAFLKMLPEEAGGPPTLIRLRESKEVVSLRRGNGISV